MLRCFCWVVVDVVAAAAAVVAVMEKKLGPFQKIRNVLVPHDPEPTRTHRHSGRGVFVRVDRLDVAIRALVAVIDDSFVVLGLGVVLVRWLERMEKRLDGKGRKRGGRMHGLV
eukprot:CCRYP_017431-RB/>CCRYP_017431-RB protein AED:0.46 eAED:1.00 QI:0/0/0/1/0/0/2/0/112